TGAADNIDRHRRNLDRKSSLDRRLACGILSLTSLDHAAHINLVYLLRRYAGSVERFFDYDRSQVCCRYCAQFAAHRSDRGTAGACQYNFLCHMIFLLMMRLPKGPLSPAPGILM